MSTYSLEEIGAELVRQLKAEAPTENRRQETAQAEFLTRKEAAKLLHISLPTLATYIKNGKIEGYRIQGRVLLRKSEVLQSVTKINVE